MDDLPKDPKIAGLQSLFPIATQEKQAMRLLQIMLISVLAILALPSTALGQAQQFFSIERVPVDGDTLFNPCTGEEMLLSGTLQIKLKGTLDNNGWVHFVATFTPQGISAIGQLTGTHYREVGIFRQTERFEAGELPVVLTVVDKFRFVSAGPSDNFFPVDVLMHITVNANGETTADVFKMLPKCIG